MENEQPKETQDALAKPAPQKITTTSVDNSEFACFLDTAKFNQLWRVSQVFAASQLVPMHYQQKPNDCFVATQMALRLGTDPMMFMQNTYVIHGKPGMLSQLVIALINARGPFCGPIQWKFTGKGDTRACTAYAKHKATGEICEATVSWDMATKEGWTTKKGSKWQTMPDLMFQYRSAAFLGRLYCPECLMGMRTVDELNDITANEESTQEPPAAGIAGLKDRMAKQVESAEVVEPEVDVPTTLSEQIDETLEKQKQEQVEAVKDAESKDEFEEHIEKSNAEKEAEATAAENFGEENEVVELRFYCNECSHEYGEDESKKIDQCPKCLKKNVIDRQKS